ncbi:GNAT family N-acetyltransferase [Brevibacterium sp. FME37]|uniref:GNAT family N-acetyltransferase n=1 Tax=Brevibacterium sp. FME37 TaxID=2742607 RepID=UPI001865C6D8|nr:GNAT family N-acetyltransferase [Brevibacterium sp. FME37]
MLIRLARSADAEAVNELLGQLGYPQDDRGATAARLQAWGDAPAGAAYLAEADGEALGVIAVYVCPFFEHDGAWARITALVVSERACGLGVGSRLVDAAEAFAARHGCSRVEVTSHDGRVNAHRFYERCGYTIQTGLSSRFLRDLST